MKILFLGFAVPDQMMDEISRKDHNQPQIAAHKLQWNIIRGIEKASGQPMDLISAVAASDYPSFPQIFFSHLKFKHRQDADDTLMPFVNIIILKHITRFLSSLILVFAWLFRNRRSPGKQILIYGMHSPFLLAALLTTRFLKAKVVLIVPDLPAYTDFGIRRGLIRRLTKPIDTYLLTRMMRKVQGLIVLTRYMAEDLAPKLPALVMEGAVSLDEIEGNKENESVPTTPVDLDEIIIMYAGALVKEYGMELLLDAFARLQDRRYRLWLCGKGPMEESIREAAMRDDRIVYWGFLLQDELLFKLRQATILAHPRLSGARYVRYSFPSKLLEYMKVSRPVVSTALPGIPDEYYEYLYVLKEETPEELARLLSEVCSKSSEELSQFGQRAREFVERRKNYAWQGQRVYEFLTTL